MTAVAQLHHSLTTTPITTILSRKSKEAGAVITLNEDDELQHAIQVLALPSPVTTNVAQHTYWLQSCIIFTNHPFCSPREIGTQRESGRFCRVMAFKPHRWNPSQLEITLVGFHNTILSHMCFDCFRHLLAARFNGLLTLAIWRQWNIREPGSSTPRSLPSWVRTTFAFQACVRVCVCVRVLIHAIGSETRPKSFQVVESTMPLSDVLFEFVNKNEPRLAVEFNNMLVDVVTPSDIISFIASIGLEHLGLLSVGELGIGTKGINKITWNSPAIHAFYLMWYLNIPSVAVIDENARLVTAISASDIKVRSLMNPWYHNLQCLLRDWERPIWVNCSNLFPRLQLNIEAWYAAFTIGLCIKG